MLNLLLGLVAYCLKKNKPSVNITDVERNSMLVALAELVLLKLKNCMYTT